VIGYLSALLGKAGSPSDGQPSKLCATLDSSTNLHQQKVKPDYLGRVLLSAVAALAIGLVFSTVALAQNEAQVKAGLEVWKSSGCADCLGPFANGDKERDEAPTGADIRTARLDAAALPVAPLPQVDYPTILVSATLPGASPETMASSVATPLERQFGQISELTQMTSVSSLGLTNITLQFDLNRNIDGAAQDVQTAMIAASGQLSKNLPNPPTFRKVNPVDSSPKDV
jgi:hypothetical protein